MSVRKGTKLPSQPRKRVVRPPDNQKSKLSSPKQIQRSIERDLALTVRAQREQEENVAEEGRIGNARTSFELTRDQIVFGIKVAVTVLCMAALLVFFAANPDPVELFVSCGGTIAGVVALLFRPRSG